MVAWQISAGVLEAGSRYSREASEIDQSLIVKTIIGLSETQCILKCRRNADCKNSLYEKGGDAKTSYCHFLKDTGGSGINSINSRNGIVHEKIVLIGMLFKIQRGRETIVLCIFTNMLTGRVYYARSTSQVLILPQFVQEKVKTPLMPQINQMKYSLLQKASKNVHKYLFIKSVYFTMCLKGYI